MFSKLAVLDTDEFLPSKKAKTNDASVDDEADAMETAVLRFRQAKPELARVFTGMLTRRRTRAQVTSLLEERLPTERSWKMTDVYQLLIAHWCKRAVGGGRVEVAGHSKDACQKKLSELRKVLGDDSDLFDLPTNLAASERTAVISLLATLQSKAGRQKAAASIFAEGGGWAAGGDTSCDEQSEARAAP